MELAPSSVDLQIYFWTGSTQANVLAVSDRVVTGIKTALDAAGIDMPYPHTVLVLDEASSTAREAPISTRGAPAAERAARPAPARA